MKVMKFGGTSVAHASNINKVIDIILDSKKGGDNIVIVVSALSGITDDLIMLANLASKKDLKYKIIFKAICGRHNQAIKELIDSKNQERVLREINKKYSELEEITKNIFSAQELSLSALDAVMSFGEQLSSFIIGNGIKSRGIPCEFVDSRAVIKTDDNFGSANVDLEKSYKLMSDCFEGKTLSIMGGFMASTKNGMTTTLGRGGSDYTASLVGAALDASVIEIWTDVDGIMTEDPKKMKNALLIPEITYEKAEEMAYNGAKVIHPKTIRPAILKNIPIYVKNTFNPMGSGTKISNGKK
ncbi:MAG: Bifunctional protein: aspartokinase I, homoserine dehydrogenase [Candidatus Yanofskybacteria bacterium GW2011_GWC2_37_9]|uniref:Aspartokinase n=1 Tax=Candidatus Yanofskybacteria bacterium GW2011_GWC2_37_9 TaxID=1619028 RepID=A0A0G0I8G3_9BACT|nr:MAG: Bifunctional protein: aspartokinase I, homoserine dehydrogenase [Candidatus Yanofskybacteria bacterium GW2011_GWC2_37_9]